MSFVLTHTRRVREAFKAPGSLAVDLLVLGVLVGLVSALFSFGKEVVAPYHQRVEINLSIRALPLYTFFSLSRGFAAYFLSLLFTLAYGTIAAHNRRAERIMLPALDVLQSMPVLSFLPTVVLAMIALFPRREMGLEIACVIMIFTAQVWNMTFSFFGSLRGIPNPLREVAVVNRLSWWRTFRLLEVPAAMIGLVWNSMMSMAGGWFVLNVSEAFTLGDHDFRLPGIGSYMSEAVNQSNTKAIIAAIIAMVLMIVIVDQLFWRPIVVWSERFKVEETAEADKAESWVINLLKHSRIGKALLRLFDQPRSMAASDPGSPRATTAQRPSSPSKFARLLPTVLGWAVTGLIVLAAARGAWKLISLLRQIPLHGFDAQQGSDWVHLLLALCASFARTMAAVLIGAIWCLPVGIFIGRSPKWSQRLQPVVQIVASFPANMFFPLVTLFFLEIHFPFTTGCVFLILLGSQWYILFNVIAGAMAIPSELKEVADVYGTPMLRKWTRVYIPAVFPYLVTGLITAAGGAWNATIISEYVQAQSKTYTAFGLGSIISEATVAGNYPLLAGATVTMAVAVVTLNRLFWKRLYRVAENRYSLNV